MENRVSVDEVKEIFDTDLSDPFIEAFISAANQVVTKHLGSSTSLSSEQLKEIERWLTAHLLTAREPRAKAEAADGARIEIQGQFGKGLDSTTYGQMAKMLDTTGTLARVVGKQEAFLHAVTSFE